MKIENKQQEDKQMLLHIHSNKLILTIVLSLFVFLFLTSVVYSHPTTNIINYNFEQGYTIVGNTQNYILKYTDFEYNVFVYNSSTGSLINDEEIVCLMYIVNEKGESVFYDNISYLGGYWGVVIHWENLTGSDYFSYGVSCNNGFGGTLTGVWEVKDKTTGLFKLDLESNFSVFVLWFLFMFAILMIYFQKLSISGFIFIMTGLIMLFSELNVIASIVSVFIGILILFIDNYNT